MKKGLIILSALFLLGWLVGYFIFHLGMPIHLCPAVSLLLYIQSVITPDMRTEPEIKAGY